ncbi:MAG: thymidine phosphorylase [Fuerstiella sp.]|nr:thymidine phosphorylase [Fuerstiella sp.]MCP4787126.1 thymidine phosphorylase [Fuerstiella sp.]MCP4859156.1 thymidine phosphorylase [Fuerstiella sp.]
MIPAQIIARKRDGAELSDEEIAFFVAGFTDEKIPDYQMSALAMAIYLNGMTDRETAALTQQMLQSGTTLQWPDDQHVRVDKHSTGGVGDKISIPLAPLLACLGFQVPMLSGRGLGATGGTLDKLESIHGFRTDLSLDEIHRLTQHVGCVITGASKELAPADRKLYALRDVTATVSSIPLITASIMSKKLAESLDALVLDVKFGSGAFMKTRQQATQLAHSLVRTGNHMGVTTTALLTDMNQPLGRMCGNAVEMQESIDVMKGGGPDDVRRLTIELAVELLMSTEKESNRIAATHNAESLIDSGAVFEKYCRMVRAQGGDPEAEPGIADCSDVTAPREGVIAEIDTEQLGAAIIWMGGGRVQMADQIDHAVGLEMLVRVGDAVEKGQPIARIYCEASQAYARPVQSAITVADEADPVPLIVDRIAG